MPQVIDLNGKCNYTLYNIITVMKPNLNFYWIFRNVTKIKFKSKYKLVGTGRCLLSYRNNVIPDLPLDESLLLCNRKSLIRV